MKKETFYLTWYDPIEENEVGVEKLPTLTERKVRNWFWLQRHQDAGACLIVRASQRRRLQKITKHNIDLNAYDYFVESRSRGIE